MPRLMRDIAERATMSTRASAMLSIKCKAGYLRMALAVAEK
jgi:hypothetical protein